MARTSQYLRSSITEMAVILMPNTQQYILRPDEAKTSDFNQWWEEYKHVITGEIMGGNVPMSVQQQYKLDLAREGKLANVPGLVELDEEIEALSCLDSDWNEEGAPQIDKSSIQQAHAFLRQLAYETSDEIGDWDLPSVYPSIDGGVQLYWNKAELQFALYFRPNERGIEYLVKKQGLPAERGPISKKEAVARARRAIRVA
jgi:hypothetical protein